MQMEQLSVRIRKIREAYDLTQLDIANRMEISPNAYGKIERNANHSSYETLSRVASSIGISLLFLIDTDNTQYIEKIKNNI